MTLDPGGIAGIALLLTALIAMHLLRNKEPGASTAQFEAWQRDHDAANPPGPPLTDAEIADLRARYVNMDEGALALVPDPARPIHELASRLGGPVWLERGEEWPTDAAGSPLRFLAQLDFADMTTLAGYPSRGLVQLFVGSGDLHGMNVDHPEQGAVRAMWRPEGFVAPVRHDPPALPPCSPLSAAAERDGIGLRDLPFVSHAGWNDYRVDALFDGLHNRPNIMDVETALLDAELGPERGEDDYPENTNQVHHFGGNPVFVQDDVRHDPALQGYDTVLLRLTSDAYVQWGDVGEANFLMRHEDLAARRFDRLLFTWDCS